ncbi:MAG: hypothetical protein JNL72_05170 [Flavipsychrobacter sp.]|nr:hypothetical protein [Flavipsychrobacter sp.]
MKRLLLACFLLTATCATTNVMAQGTTTTQTPKATFVATFNQMDQHLLNNQVNLAKQDFESMKPMFISNFAVGKSAIHSETNPTTKASLLNTYTQKQNIYTQIIHLAQDLAANRVAIMAKFNEYADLY